jgi:hypothetical protein
VVADRRSTRPVVVCETPPRDAPLDERRTLVIANRLDKAWRRAASLAPEHSLALPFDGEYVAVIGTGLARGVARAYAALREDAAHGATDAPAADDAPPRRYDRTILLSHRGDEPALAELLQHLRSEAILAIALGAPGGSPVDELAGVTIPLAVVDGVGGDEAAYALTAFAVLRNHLLGATGTDHAARATRAALPDASRVDRWVFTGRREALGLGSTAALALRRRGADAIAGPPSQLTSGDLGPLDARTLVWWFGAPDGETPGRARGGSPGEPDDGDENEPMVRTSSLNPVAELILALRLADALD